MKKIVSLILTLAMTFTLAACGNSDSAQSSDTEPSSTESVSSSEDTPQMEEPTQAETGESAASLVVYFSWSGNTESVANEIQAQTGAGIFEIVPAEPYTDDYDALLDIAQEEQADAARPAIAETVENFEQYETVYFGFPNWLAYHKLIQCTQLA